MLKTILLVAAISIGAITIAHCEETHTTSWYMLHPEQMQEKLEWCSFNEPDADCVNATRACLNIVSTRPPSAPIPACVRATGEPE